LKLFDIIAYGDFMDLLDKGYFLTLEKKLTVKTVIFLIICVLCLVGYIYSFTFGLLYASMLAGVAGVIICILYYYLAIFEIKHLVKLNRNIAMGISQEDTFVFEKLDGETEYDGVRLTRLLTSYTGDDELFERTLYFISALPHPTLEVKQKITVRTYRNIIIEMKEQ